jgi:hypothetical protein
MRQPDDLAKESRMIVRLLIVAATAIAVLSPAALVSLT